MGSDTFANCSPNRCCLWGGTATGPGVERSGRPAPQRFRQELLIRRGLGVGAHVCCELGAFVRSLVVVESSLYVDAVNRIVDAVLNVPGVGHGNSLNVHRSPHSEETRAGDACSPGPAWRSN